MPALRAQLLVLAVAACVSLAAGAQPAAGIPDALTVDGGHYFGPLRNGKLHGKGRMQWGNGARYEGRFADGLLHGKGTLHLANGQVYEGEFAKGLMSGRGRMQMADGAVYVGSFRNDYFHGEGRYEMRDGAVYEGSFERGEYNGRGTLQTAEGERYSGRFTRGEFTGEGTYTARDGSRFEGAFVKWRWQGKGRFVDAAGTIYEGLFPDGLLNGPAKVVFADGSTYEGELEFGQFHGQGTLKYAKPRPDGRTEESGTWRFGRLDAERERRTGQLAVEEALYAQRRLLDQALAALEPRVRGKINMYLLAVAGDGSQEVFRREVEFVKSQFDERFGTRGRSLALVNSRATGSSVPMATVTSIREALQAIAARMDPEEDILFLFLTSHGSKEHELTLNQNGMSLRGLPAGELAEALRASGIRWKVVVVSACYSGGFIDHLKDERSLVLAAARHDRRSFGCADENDFTHFGRAFFHDALPSSGSFQDAFHAADALVKERETKQEKISPEDSSLPQMHDAPPIREHLRRWWAELM